MSASSEAPPTLAPLGAGAQQALRATLAILLPWFLALPVAIPVLDLDPAGVAFPIAMLTVLVLPVAAFGAAYSRSDAFRDLVLSLDVRFVAFFQSVRIVGLVFVSLYMVGRLPGAFAVWAGGIDVVIGLTAPFVGVWLVTRVPFPKRAFVAWNWLGLSDFVVGIPIALLYSAGPLGVLAGDVDTGIMTRFPQSFFAAGVPVAAMLHLTCLLQVRGRGRPASLTPPSERPRRRGD